MQINYDSLWRLIAFAIALLPVFVLLDRWWRERIYNLQGKTILITGGSRGLGLVMARQLIDAGARLAICARDAAELERAQTELGQRGGEVLALTCDVTDQAQVEQMVQQVLDRFRAIDILINNAGTDIVGPVETLTMQDYDDMMKLHFWAPLYTMYAVLPQMRQLKNGRIVNISSIGGKLASPHMVGYCASKFALVGLSEGMRTELALDGIAVTTVCPGFIRTGVVDHAVIKGQHRKEFAWFSIGDSLPLISASAEKVARATIAGLRRGATEVIVPLPTWFSVKFYALFPGLSTNLFGLVNRFLPEPGGIGKERAFGKDSHSAWSPSWLTYLSNRAARRNNELPVTEPKGTTEVKQVGTDNKRSPQPTLAEDKQSGFPLIDPSQAPPEVQACFNDIQNTLGIPWKPANWRAYGMFPTVMQLFWQRLKRATQTESFLEDAIALNEQVYQDVNDWYQPSYQIDVDRAAQRQIQRELNAFSFGNPQLLIQQIALSKTLAGEVVGQDGNADMRGGSHAYRHPEIQLIGEQEAREISTKMQSVYRDIKQTLGVPIVNSDYQALAHWSDFFIVAWEDIKLWRERPEYQLLKQAIVQRAENAASRLSPAVVIGESEVRDLLDNPEDFQQIQQTVQMFTDILPELMIQDALFYLGLAGVQPAIAH
ncbi:MULTISPECIES: SDR family NAD(P)-dependent oxidoreductase [Calothrix]|uniref:SDR family NAD(P)-dependent oxidoreductase n=2 Tax=Calothrix TaxID=1186 RepID=A0ABR8ABL3_9CYAN|nr:MULTISPECIES: SDR family NAD(P)-dependent oxidoreductase [Calothrix]MBD2196830.1 SDR family NAD(P)-dependent oxidoreductase [Calothrix parietina FACHB-288]MBD2225382.1 SDR family NAD(P)-dependent oxidoreductase [Calothrix anomala FACHB-343]